MMEIKGVRIGDQFQDLRRAEYIETVVDIYTVTNLKGEIVRHECIAEHEFCGQTVRAEVPFASVQRHRIKKEK